MSDILTREFGISPALLAAARRAEDEIRPVFARIDAVSESCSYKVLAAFRKNRIADTHFAWNTGYGYDDAGRAAVERVYADVFGAEAALVRPLIVNGTHAISLALTGVLRPSDELLYCTGAPYDTIQPTIGLTGDEGNGSLREYGVTYQQAELLPGGDIDRDAVRRAITPATRVIALQRATGYSDRKALTMAEIAGFTAFCHDVDPDIILFVDNCYGEFLDELEPSNVGADIVAGSLIKNPGGGLALSGGYIAGRQDLIERVACRMTTPGIGGECGLTFGQTRTILQGLFIAPHVVAGAQKGAVFCARLFENLGFSVSPRWDEERSDIIETVRLGSPEALIAFCEGIQSASPVDSHVRPEPWDMPGYDDKVIMAAGAFVQGSSIEMSADGPLREPFNVYFQGGLTYEHAKTGVLAAAQRLIDKGIIKTL
ncbi:MAG: methionine gamma-lyase family protein [Clostridiales Family XIII bacterium]|jgi:cystathionine beta-lyase family protein involved in aluminum resistance|nr:methionine gamma-lyase family protein [Clostridiales Family XIII bacterium]